MSRSTRAFVAVGAAVALMAGSGATFARWYDEQAISGSVVSTGELSLEHIDASDSWLINTADQNQDADPTVAFDPATDRIVPGDVVTYRTQVKVHLKGKNLQATFAVLPQEGKTIHEDLSVEVTGVDCDGANASQLTQADDGKICTVDTTIIYNLGADDSTSALPEKNVGNTDDIHGEGWQAEPLEQGEPLSIDGFHVVLEQNMRGN